MPRRSLCAGGHCIAGAAAAQPAEQALPQWLLLLLLCRLRCDCVRGSGARICCRGCDALKTRQLRAAVEAVRQRVRGQATCTGVEFARVVCMSVKLQPNLDKTFVVLASQSPPSGLPGCEAQPFVGSRIGDSQLSVASSCPKRDGSIAPRPSLQTIGDLGF